MLITSSLVALFTPPSAHAHADPNIVVRLEATTPALPPGAELSVLDAAVAYLSLSNSTATPALALDPGGNPFLQVSSAGVLGLVDSDYLPLTGRQASEAKPDRPECCPSGQWVKLSSQTVWSWPDPRLDPPELRAPQAVRDRGLGSLQSGEPMARWSVRIRYGNQVHRADGVLERRALGEVRSSVDAVPPGLSASVINARPPQLRLVREPGLTVVVLGRDGKDFLRITDRSVLARSASLEYKIHRRAIGLPAKSDSVWVPLGGSNDTTRIVWADQRLGAGATEAITGTQRVTLSNWSIPVKVDGTRSAIRGTTYFEPELEIAGNPDSGSPVWRQTTSYLVAGVLTLVLAGAYTLSRRTQRTDEV